MNRITFHKNNGDWGIEGVDLTELSPKVYGALQKLCHYEDKGIQPDDIDKICDKISDMIIWLECVNIDFVCGDCIRTKEKLMDILKEINPALAHMTGKECERVKAQNE